MGLTLAAPPFCVWMFLVLFISGTVQAGVLLIPLKSNPSENSDVVQRLSNSNRVIVLRVLVSNCSNN